MMISEPAHSLPRSHYTLSFWMHIFVPLLLIVFVVVFQFNQVQAGRLRQLEHSSMNAQDIGSTLASSISGSFQNIDLTLLAASDHIRDSYQYKNKNESEVIAALRELQSRVPAISFLQAADVRGNTIFNTYNGDDESVNIADRWYFQQLKNNPAAEMIISEPLLGRSSKKWVLVCARRLTLTNGAFGGIVYASIELDGIANRLAGGNLKLSGDDVIMLRDNEHNVIVRFAHGVQDLSLLGKKSTSPDLAALDAAHAQSGSYIANSSVDQVRRSYYFQRIPGRSISLVVGIAVKDALAEWELESKKSWGVIAILICVIIFSAALILRSKLHHQQAFSELQNTQIALELSNQELARLSTTDSLTGLANRRKFEEVSAHEWLRAQRKQEPLTVAMVDVDFFKIYNDLYGHQSGDLCLQMVAKTLAAGLRDGSDFVARYGGEEFIILLPGQHAEGAYDVLDRLRRDIAESKLSHVGSQFISVITFSVGFAVAIPQAGKTVTELIEQADQNLYIAKRNGKNQVVGTSECGQMISSKSTMLDQTYGA